MIHERFVMTCDSCSTQYPEEFDTYRDCLKYPQKEGGWIELQVENGSYWHLCPKCKEEYEKEGCI